MAMDIRRADFDPKGAPPSDRRRAISGGYPSSGTAAPERMRALLGDCLDNAVARTDIWARPMPMERDRGLSLG
jgi:hypothetical protein